MQEARVPSLSEEDSQKEMTARSSIPAWRIPWTEEPGGLQYRGCKESDTTEHTRDYAGRSQHCSPCSDTVIPRCIHHLFCPETWAWEMCPLHWGLLRRNTNTFTMLLPSLIITSLPKRRCSVVCMLEWRRYGTEFKPVGKEDITEVGNKPQLQGIKVQGQVTTV